RRRFFMKVALAKSVWAASMATVRGESPRQNKYGLGKKSWINSSGRKFCSGSGPPLLALEGRYLQPCNSDASTTCSRFSGLRTRRFSILGLRLAVRNNEAEERRGDSFNAGAAPA